MHGLAEICQYKLQHFFFAVDFLFAFIANLLY